jgi:hypothetical protein
MRLERDQLSYRKTLRLARGKGARRPSGYVTKAGKKQGYDQRDSAHWRWIWDATAFLGRKSRGFFETTALSVDAAFLALVAGTAYTGNMADSDARE